MDQQILAEDRWIEIPKGRLLARCWQSLTFDKAESQQAPIVLFHDSLGCIALWRTFPAILAEYTGRRVIAYDRLGFGQSDPRTDTLSMDFIRQEAEQFFPAVQEQLALEYFIAFGHSVGGAMAVHCAALYANACVGLITESAQAFVENKIRTGIRQAREIFKNIAAFERLQLYHGAKTRWVLDAWINTWLAPEFDQWSLNEVLPQVKCPTLIIHGSEDEYGSLCHPEQIAQLIGAPTQLEIMQGIKHVPHREQEQRVAQLAAVFLASIP